MELDDADETKPTAWLFFNEAHGLGEELLGLADHRVRIDPGAGNPHLATAASICLYESGKAQARGRDNIGMLYRSNSAPR